MKWKWKSLSHVRLWDPMDCSLPDSSVHGILQARILEWVACSLLHGIFPTQGVNPGLPHCRWIFFFTVWATRDPKNTGVGSLYLLWWIFPTQELKQGLLHCRRILYQLSYRGSWLGTRGQAIRYEATLSRSRGGTVKHIHRCFYARSQVSRLV